MKSAAGYSGDFSLIVFVVSSACVVFRQGPMMSLNGLVPFSPSRLLALLQGGERDAEEEDELRRNQEPRDQNLTRSRLCRKGKKSRMTGSDTKINQTTCNQNNT